jgi:hypothetical protein
MAAPAPANFAKCPFSQRIVPRTVVVPRIPQLAAHVMPASVKLSFGCDAVRYLLIFMYMAVERLHAKM